VEECEEDQNAHGVIQQLTMSVLSSTGPEAIAQTVLGSEIPVVTPKSTRTAPRAISDQYPSRGASRELSTVGEEGSSTSPIHAHEAPIVIHYSSTKSQKWVEIVGFLAEASIISL